MFFSNLILTTLRIISVLFWFYSGQQGKPPKSIHDSFIGNKMKEEARTENKSEEAKDKAKPHEAAKEEKKEEKETEKENNERAR